MKKFLDDRDRFYIWLFIAILLYLFDVIYGSNFIGLYVAHEWAWCCTGFFFGKAKAKNL